MQSTGFLRKAVLAGALSLTLASPALADVFVHGYTHGDGTYVHPHWRSDPDGVPSNNFSYPGNLNPYTGQVAPGAPYRGGLLDSFRRETPWPAPADSPLFDTDD